MDREVPARKDKVKLTCARQGKSRFALTGFCSPAGLRRGTGRFEDISVGLHVLSLYVRENVHIDYSRVLVRSFRDLLFLPTMVLSFLTLV